MRSAGLAQTSMFLGGTYEENGGHADTEKDYQFSGDDEATEEGRHVAKYPELR